MKTFIIVLLTLSVHSLWSQIAFYKVFTDQGSDRGQGVAQLADSSYIITGSSSSFPSSSSQVFLMKLDKNGNKLWSRNYGGSESEIGRRVMVHPNGGFFIAGYTNSNGNGGFDVYLIKTDYAGNPEWEKYYGGSGWEKVNDAKLTSDGGMMIIGNSNSNETNNNDILVLRTDISGDSLWSLKIGGEGNDEGNSIKQFTDTSFIICGTLFNTDSLQSKGYIAEISDQGNILWESQLGFSGNYICNDICIRPTQIVGVGAKFDIQNNADEAFFWLDLSGTLINESYLPGSGGNEITEAVINYEDSTKIYIASHWDNIFSLPGGSDLRISLYNIPLVIQNNYTIYHDDPDVLGELIPTSDGGMILTGYTTNTFMGANDIIVVKFGPNLGAPAAATTSESLVSVPQIVKTDYLLSIYPNPANTSFWIESDSDEIVEYSLNSLDGKEVIKGSFQNKMEIITSALLNGMYILNLSSKDYFISDRILIQH